MKTPDCVIWGLTRKNNAFLKKFNGNQWSSHPLNVSGFHNASQSASSASVQGSKRITKAKDAKKDEVSHKSKKVFEVVLRHRNRHGKKTHSKNSQSAPAFSRHAVTKNVHRVQKIVSGLTYQSDNHKKQLLRRLARVDAANRSHA
jgi:hypothetical protein